MRLAIEKDEVPGSEKGGYDGEVRRVAARISNDARGANELSQLLFQFEVDFSGS
mgnify:CR=1 FL=1